MFEPPSTAGGMRVNSIVGAGADDREHPARVAMHKQKTPATRMQRLRRIECMQLFRRHWSKQREEIRLWSACQQDNAVLDATGVPSALAAARSVSKRTSS